MKKIKRVYRSISSLFKKPFTISRKILKSINTIYLESGFLKTVIKEKSFDNEGDALPWYTYSAINYLKTLDLSNSTIFEYGSGMSSVFFSKRAKQVVSVENVAEWYEIVNTKTQKNN